MNIKRTKEEIKDTISAYLLKDEFGNYQIPSIRQRPVFLLGSPGIGKTQIMEQIAKECGIGLVAYTITHHTRQSAIGLPFISQKQYGEKEYAVTEYTMSEIVGSIYEKMEQTGLTEGILFIDEINCVSETLAPAMLQFLQCKSFGNHKIPEGWVIVAAGNPPEYNKSVREFDVVTMDRVKKIQVEADFGVWKEYAYTNQLHGAVISYLNTRKQNFYQMENTVDGMHFATPRGWEDLSNMIQVYEKLGKTIDREVVEQYIQFPKIAKDFANYLELYYKYRTDYQIEEIFQGKPDEILLKKVSHASFDERLSVVGLILSKVNEAMKNAVRAQRYMELLQSYLMEYKLLIEDNAGSEGHGETECGAGTERVNEKREDGLNGQQLFSNICQKAAVEYKQKKKAELLTREEDYRYRQVIRTLEKILQEMKMLSVQDADACFAKAKVFFTQENEQYEKMHQEAEQRIEYAFDFMEGAFGNSQEMVMFITELNSNAGSVAFLQESECERYYQYNKELLFDDKRKKLLEKIQ